MKDQLETLLDKFTDYELNVLVESMFGDRDVGKSGRPYRCTVTHIYDRRWPVKTVVNEYCKSTQYNGMNALDFYSDSYVGAVKLAAYLLNIEPHY